MLGSVRDWRFNAMMASQPKIEMLDGALGTVLGVLSIMVGATLVLSSFWALGFTGTFLGDYFGIYLDERVTGFPFNVTDNPMYWGTTMNFVGFALWNASAAGLLMIPLIVLVYKIIIQFEEPFTTMIYANKAQNDRKKS
ncbi:phosphatidylethanolamine N-methyltransferase-like [Glandiceps talaboti]